MLSEFVDWANQLGAVSRHKGVGVTVTIGEVSSNPSARLDIDAAGRIGRVTFWESGQYHAEVLAVDSGEMLYSKHGVTVLGEPLTECFQPFLQQFGISE